MKRIKLINSYKLLLLLIVTALITFGFLGDDHNGTRLPQPLYKFNTTEASGKNGDAYAMKVNNIYLPMNRKGNIGEVNVPPGGSGGPSGSGGQYAGHVFLFSSGFFLSGYANGGLWANAVAPSSLVEDYVPGTVEGGQSDSRAVIYVLNSQDVPFGQSWQDWIDAVALGADFYDGDGDGNYNPVDNNGNGMWDPEEDRPDLIGDEMVWCVYNDGIPAAQRRWTVDPRGIEIRQSVFAFASAGAIGNLVFVRYRFKYVGLGGNDPDQLDDVLFGVWADPDLGQYDNDLVGVDVPRNAGYTYNDEFDDQYGNTPPCFMIDFFSGPAAYIAGETYIDVGGEAGKYDEGIDTPLDTAVSVRGQIIGVKYFPGAKNLPISSFVEYLNGDQNLNDPSLKEEARSYMEGKNRVGEEIDPCTFAYGNVSFAGCDTTNNKFWFSGDPVTSQGWIATVRTDVRQMTTTGAKRDPITGETSYPFVLNKDEEKEIIVAYVVAKGKNPLDAITVATRIDDGAQNIFNLNFLAPSPPPPPEVKLSSSDNFIDIIWDTPNQVSYVNTTPTWDLHFEGYNVWAFKTGINEDIIGGEENSILIASFDLDDFIKDVYKENSATGGIELLYPQSQQLDFEAYTDPNTGKIRVRIFNDPFRPSDPVTKGKPYYFAVTSYALNYRSLVYKDPGDTTLPTNYYLSAAAFAQEAENIRNIVSITVGEDLYNPPLTVEQSNHISGASTGIVGPDIIDVENLHNNTYEVTFFNNTSSGPYSMYWNLTNITTGTVLEDSGSAYTYGSNDISIPVTEGFILRLQDQTPKVERLQYEPSGAVWYRNSTLDTVSSTLRGIWYPGKDIPGQRKKNVPIPFGSRKSTYMTADKLRHIELRWGPEGVGKAYRYIYGYKSNVPPPSQGIIYANAITSSDTVGKGVVGNWDTVNDRANGFVDVPFTAWVVDERRNEEYQLAVGFMEAQKTGQRPYANPDGKWDPTSHLDQSDEILVIFSSPYDPNGNQIELTGGDFQTASGSETVWADLVRLQTNNKKVPDDAVGISEEQRAIFNSPWLSSMYVLGLQRLNDNSWLTEGDKTIIPLVVYPYTENDVYQFTTLEGRTITEDQERELWKKVNVYPNPLYGFNTLTAYTSNNPDEPFVTFTNLPQDIEVKIYSLSGTLVRTLNTDDKSSPSSPFLRWNLQNQSGLRVASGMYLAIVSSPLYGDKVLKFAIIMPQKQIQRF